MLQNCIMNDYLISKNFKVHSIFQMFINRDFLNSIPKCTFYIIK